MVDAALNANRKIEWKGSMNKRIGSGCFVLICATVLSVFAGCATTDKTPPRSHITVKTSQQLDHRNGWWYVRFKMAWPEGDEPAWYMDPMLAHRVISPVLKQYSQDIVLWRFHRRAVRDQTGHQFSFIFYSSPEAAQSIYTSIAVNGTLNQLTKHGMVTNVSYDNTRTVAKPDIEDTSDRKWSPNLQKAWPYFIMGASKTWLDLIELNVQQSSGDSESSSIKDLKALYIQVNNSIDALWQKEGSHAFLHHLNAIFGYVPVQFYERKLLNF